MELWRNKLNYFFFPSQLNSPFTVLTQQPMNIDRN